MDNSHCFIWHLLLIFGVMTSGQLGETNTSGRINWTSNHMNHQVFHQVYLAEDGFDSCILQCGAFLHGCPVYAGIVRDVEVIGEEVVARADGRRLLGYALLWTLK